MTVKLLEIRDRGTAIPALAIRLDTVDDRERWILGRAGFYQHPEAYVLLLLLNDAPYDPYGHATRARTIPIAHQHLIDHFDEVAPGAVVDVEFLLGESVAPKISEQLTVPWE